MGASAWPRWRCRKLLLHTGRSDAGESGSRLSRMCVSHGTRSMPELRATWPAGRSWSNARRAGDVREHRANADRSAALHDMSVSLGRAAGMSAKPLRTNPQSASAERYWRPLGATVDMDPPHDHTHVCP
jgi:hypothetical protein